MKPSDPLCLSTPRLTLMPFSADLLQLVLTDRAALEQRLSARFLPRWDWKDGMDYLTMVRRAVQGDPSSRVWWIYFILHNRDKVVIGDVGLKGPPNRLGSVEIHYGLVPAYRGQGCGFEAVQALVRWAFTRPEVRLITAVCDHDNTASIRLLQKLGMRRVRVQGRSPLWCLSMGLRTLEKLGMRRGSAFLGRLWRRMLRLEKLGMRGVSVKGPSLVWHLPRARYAERAMSREADLRLTSE